MSPPPYVHRLVQALVEDPAKPPDLALLNGYIGPSDNAAYVRLYRNLMMNVWLDIPAEMIVHIDHVPPSSTSPWGEDVIWMSRQAARGLEAESSVPGASRPSAGREQVGPGTGGQPATESSPVVQIYVDGAGTASTRPRPPDGDGPISGGGRNGVTKQWPPN